MVLILCKGLCKVAVNKWQRREHNTMYQTDQTSEQTNTAEVCKPDSKCNSWQQYDSIYMYVYMRVRGDTKDAGNPKQLDY